MTIGDEVLFDFGNSQMFDLSLNDAITVAEAIQAGIKMMYPNGFAVNPADYEKDSPVKTSELLGTDNLPKTEVITDAEHDAWHKEDPYFGYIVRYADKSIYLSQHDMNQDRRTFTGTKETAHIFPTKYGATRFTQAVPRGAEVEKHPTSYLVFRQESPNSAKEYYSKTESWVRLRDLAAIYPYSEAVAISDRLDLSMERVLA